MSDTGRNTADIRIDTAQDTDVAGIVRVERDSWVATYPNDQAHVSADDVRARFSDTRRRQAAITHELRDTQHRYLVARLDSRVIGYCHVLKEPAWNHVVELYLLPCVQRRGVGHTLLGHALHWLDAGKPMQVAVVAYNTNAIAFYKREGFAVDPTLRPSPDEDWNVLPSGMRLPVVIMTGPA